MAWSENNDYELRMASNTVFDDAYKTLVEKYPRLITPVIVVFIRGDFEETTVYIVALLSVQI